MESLSFFWLVKKKCITNPAVKINATLLLYEIIFIISIAFAKDTVFLNYYDNSTKFKVRIKIPFPRLNAAPES